MISTIFVFNNVLIGHIILVHRHNQDDMINLFTNYVNSIFQLKYINL